MTAQTDLARQVHEFVRRDFTHRFGETPQAFGTHPVWKKLRALGTELWLDTGSMEESAPLWTREFTALTTNNTLLNREVQKGQYDTLIKEANALLAKHRLSDRERLLEIAFILNARHALKLVQTYDAFVSVEEHTDLANKMDAAVTYAKRYHDICPERFIVKIPLTPAGLLATRRIAREGIPVNHTLGFSARQNYVVARIAKPKFVNVFLGRLNSFVADNRLGPGALVGEKATLASQAAVAALRKKGLAATRQIGASFRDGGQVVSLAGIDVMTMPPKVAQQVLDLKATPESLANRMGDAYDAPLNPGVKPGDAGLPTLWEISPKLVACVDKIGTENLDAFSPADVLAFFSRNGCGDVFVPWTDEQVATSAKEGKIPRLENWREPLAAGRIGLDSLMNLAGLNSFIADQAQMDKRVQDVLASSAKP
jgi:transaldolase